MTNRINNERVIENDNQDKEVCLHCGEKITKKCPKDFRGIRFCPCESSKKHLEMNTHLAFTNMEYERTGESPYEVYLDAYWGLYEEYKSKYPTVFIEDECKPSINSDNWEEDMNQ